MLKVRKAIYFMLILGVLLFGKIGMVFAATTGMSSLNQLTIFAPSSMAYVLNEISRVYALKNQVIISIVYGNVKEMAESISKDKQASVVITETQSHLDELIEKNILNMSYSQEIASNLIVVVSGSDMSLEMKEKLSAVKDFTSKTLGEALINHDLKLLFAIKEEGSALYLGGFLEELSTDSQLKEDKIIYNKSDDLAYAINGSNDILTIDYYSNVFDDQRFFILSPLNTQMYDPVFYQASITKDGEYMNIAKDFYKFLGSHEVQSIFQRHGFLSHL